MFGNQKILPPLLAAVVSIPGFVIGQQVRHGDPGNVVLLVPLLLAVVVVASLLMRQSD